MAWLNYQHLYYFWVIAREGGLSRAAAALHLTHSTLSVQLRALEDSLGERLFERRGRALVLTAFGRDVQQYAGEIFRMGDELLELAGGRASSPRRFEVGVVGAIPKTTACKLLLPALDAERARGIRIRQDGLDRLVQELASGRLHAILSDAPSAQGGGGKLHTHPLGASEILLYGRRDLAERYRRGFPRSLDGAPLLLPGADTSLRRAIDRWLAVRGLRVDAVGEIDDAGHLRAFGVAGRGLFPVRAAIRGEVEHGWGARRVGRLTGVTESYFVISLERRVKHPAVAALIEHARRRLDAAAAS
ncbi:MAG TPA: LysR family transcriptional regulator [Kofleriaceae bacterium]|nr:LysR family transcriptional regulator [Kofleriaceae bacterium]